MCGRPTSLWIPSGGGAQPNQFSSRLSTEPHSVARHLGFYCIKPMMDLRINYTLQTSCSTDRLLYRQAGCSTDRLAALQTGWLLYRQAGCSTDKLLYRQAGCSTDRLAALQTGWLLYRQAGCSTERLAALQTGWLL
jgi:hypothetical protein